MPTERRHEGEIPMDEKRLRSLLADQFPQWADAPIAEVSEVGTDHTLFRLGDAMVARMPIRPYDGSGLENQQAGREAKTLPFLAPQLLFELPVPIAMGEPTHDYPWHWSIVSWIDGERATPQNVDLDQAALDLAGFIRALHACDPSDGPPAGVTTWGRGLSLKPWRKRVAEWTAEVDDYDLTDAFELWERVLAADDWAGPPTWFHGDLPGNLIQRDGRLIGVIDSGYAVGDPACDLMAGWNFFEGASRRTFLDAVGMDEASVMRGRGWAMAPSLIGIRYYKDVPEFRANSIKAIEGALVD